jgi:GT2 family glycosyltransferase/glycosyltransferase involved in cell wall biosynthesis
VQRRLSIDASPANTPSLIRQMLSDAISREPEVAPLVSVVVPTRNGRARLPTLLRALHEQTISRDAFEVIVVDDASTDGTGDWLEQQEDVRVIRPGRPLGQGGATNHGVACARAPLVALTDDDTIPASNWLEQGLEMFGEREVSFVGGHIELDLGPDPAPAALLDFAWGYLDQEAYIRDGFAATGNLWLRRAAFEALGGFYDAFTAQCHDVEFGRRATAAGHKLRYAPDVVVKHPPRADMRTLAKKQYRIGLSIAELRQHGVAPFCDGRPLWMHHQYYRPWLSIFGKDRLRAVGISLSRRRRLEMGLIQYVALELPLAWGTLRGQLRSSTAYLSPPEAIDGGYADRLSRLSPVPPRATRLPDELSQQEPWPFLAARVAVVSPYAPAPDGVVQYSEQLIAALQGSRSIRRIPFRGGRDDERLDLRGSARALRLLRATDADEQVLIMWHPHYFLEPRLISKLVTYLAFALVFRRRDVVVLVHEPHGIPNGAGLKQRLKSWIEERARRICWGSPMTVVMHTQHEAHAFEERFPTRARRPVELVNHGAFFRPFATPSKPEARHQLGLPPDGHIFLSIGFISPHKAIDRAVHTFARADLEDASFYCVGSPIRASDSVDRVVRELRHLADETPRFTFAEQFVDDVAFDTWIKAADTVIVRYSSAASSGVVARARMLGTPLISTAPGGIAEQLGEGDLVVTSDEELQEAMRLRAKGTLGRPGDGDTAHAVRKV